MARNKTKVCPQCKEKKPRTKKYFGIDKQGRMSWCRSCVSARAIVWGKQNRAKLDLNRRRWRLKKLYNISMEEYDARLKAQGGVCAICRKAPTDSSGRFSILHVDHDHVTGKVRDLICFTCNAGLGNMKDDPELLRTAASYLDYHRQLQRQTA